MEQRLGKLPDQICVKTRQVAASISQVGLSRCERGVASVGYLYYNRVKTISIKRIVTCAVCDAGPTERRPHRPRDA
jgi:hypothetical protein